MEIKLGRNVQGPMDILVADKFINVSKEHASIWLKDGKLFIKDLNSSNGTFINGRRILTKELNIEDVVVLGGQGGAQSYPLNLSQILEDIKKFEFNSRTDFTEEFKGVIKVYKDYQSDLISLNKKSKFKSSLPAVIIKVLVAGVVIAGLVLNLLPESIVRLQGPIIIVLVTIVGGISIFKSKEENVIENKLDLEIKYQDDYKCPKCKKEFNIRDHWKKIESKKVCPHKCGALFKN